MNEQKTILIVEDDEVDEIVELGSLDPEAIVTPSAYVDRVIVRPKDIKVDDKPISQEALDSNARMKARGSS